MSNVLVVLEATGGSLRKAARSAVAAGRALAARTGGALHAVLLGSGPDVGAAAPDRALAPQGPAVAVEWRDAHQGGDLLAGQGPQFGQIREPPWSGSDRRKCLVGRR